MLDHQRRGQSVAQSDDRVGPHHRAVGLGMKQGVWPVALFAAQRGGDGLDGRSCLGDGLRVHLGSHAGVDEFAHRPGKWFVERFEPFVLGRADDVERVLHPDSQ